MLRGRRLTAKQIAADVGISLATDGIASVLGYRRLSRPSRVAEIRSGAGLISSDRGANAPNSVIGGRIVIQLRLLTLAPSVPW